MKYFVNRAELSGTCYHEFAMGLWDGETFWREDSIYLHDDILYQHKGFIDALRQVLPDYDPYGEVTINRKQWELIGRQAENQGSDVIELFAEANDWAATAFCQYETITILGI